MPNNKKTLMEQFEDLAHRSHELTLKTVREKRVPPIEELSSNPFVQYLFLSMPFLLFLAGVVFGVICAAVGQ